MTAKITQFRPGYTPPTPPDHLGPEERDLWTRLLAAHDFDDPAALALLQAAMEARHRARRCRERIDRDGEAVKDRFKQIKPHPLLAAERDARAAFLSAMRVLRLDMEGID